MEEELYWCASDEVRWLFKPRLQFMDAQESILSRISDRSLLQDLENSKKKGCQVLNRPIASHKDIEHQLDVLNAIIVHCRFSQTSINATFKQSRNEMKTRKQVKDVEKHCKIKVRKLLDLIQSSEEQEDHWKTVLNHRNIIEHLHKMYSVLVDVIDHNFDLVEQGVAHIKDLTLPPKLQIQICILAIDIISLISSVKFAYLPYSPEEIRNNTISKFEQEEKKFLDDGLQALHSTLGFSKTYQMLKDIKINKFYETIQRIAQSLDNADRHYRVWVDTFSIKMKYLIDEEGLIKRKFDGKLDSTCVNEIALYWLQINNQHLRFYDCTHQQDNIHFGQTFKEYQHLFNYLLEEGTKKPEKLEGVTSYLGLISAVWFDIDKRESSRLFWQELIKVTNRIELPQEYFNVKKDFIVEIGKNIIDEYQQHHNQKYLEKLKAFALSNSQQLLSLDYLSDLVNDYVSKQYNTFRLLLRQRKSFEEQLLSIKAILHKISQRDQILVQEDREKDSQELKEESRKNQQPAKINHTIVQLVRELQHSFRKAINPSSNKMSAKNEEEVILQLENAYPNDQDLIDDLKYFRLLAKSFTETANIQDLKQCITFYRKQRQLFVRDKSQLSRERINQMPFGIMGSIRVVIFQLIALIKLEKQEQIKDDSMRGLQQKLQNITLKLLKIYNLKVQMRRREENLQNHEQNHNQLSQLLMLKRSSSYDINPHSFYVEDVEIKTVEDEDDIKEDGFSRNLMKKILQLRVEVILKKLEGLEAQEKPLRQEYLEIKKRVYTLPAGEVADTDTIEDIKKLPEIEYNFLMKKYYQGWRKLRDLRNPIEQTLKILERAWGGKSNILKLYANIYYKYKEYHKTTQNQYNAGELSEIQAETFINQCLESENNRSKDRAQEETRTNLRRAIRILQNLQMISTLKKQRDEQQQKLQTLEQAKHYRSEKEELKLKQLEGKLQISAVYKNDTPIMKRYTLRVEGKEFDELMIKLRKLTRLNRTITIKPDKLKSTIIMEVDEQQLSFESYPKLIKYLIESYLETIQFCKNQLHFQLYPLVLHRHIKIGKRHENHIPLKFYPYEGILLNLLLDYKDLKISNLYKYPQFPFIEFANQLNILLFKCKDKIYDPQNPTSEFYAFKHLVEEMKALSMEVEEGTRQTVKRILKCPYFWSSTDKLFELVQFKERYQSNINIEESRRKQNQRIRSELETEQDREAFTPERKHPLYKSASGYNKTTQFYFSIEGLLEKQAFLEDIGNFKDKQQEYKYHAYWWIKDKKEIQRLIEMVSERQRRKGCRKATVYEKTFNSFQNQIRNLRNLAVHYIYDDQNKKEIDLQEKINIFQAYFPKLFIFLYRWRPYLGKDYVNEIKLEKVKFLKELFNKEDKRQVYKRLESIQELSEYNIKNINGYLLKLFGYDFPRINGCEPCKIICNSLSKQESLWSFLEDVKRAKTKEGKDMTYNLLFWEHEKKACNGMKFLEKAYFNVKQRNQFTTEEFSHVKSSLTLLQVEKQRLQKKIQRQLLRQQRRAQKTKTSVEDENESSSEDSTKDAQSRNKQSVERRFNRLNGEERDELYEQMANTDYVCKYFIFQLEMKLPYLFYDLRKERYQWDDRASEFPKNQ